MACAAFLRLPFQLLHLFPPGMFPEPCRKWYFDQLWKLYKPGLLSYFSSLIMIRKYLFSFSFPPLFLTEKSGSSPVSVSTQWAILPLDDIGPAYRDCLFLLLVIRTMAKTVPSETVIFLPHFIIIFVCACGICMFIQLCLPTQVHVERWGLDVFAHCLSTLVFEIWSFLRIWCLPFQLNYIVSKS